MEELNKTQVILLTLFITFVTSVATGIVTVTLLDQSPPGITQTINRVVERTIEKVTPGKTEVKETKILLTQDDILSEIVPLVKPSLVRIVLSSPTAATEEGVEIAQEGGAPASSSLPNQAAVVLADTLAVNEIGTGFVISSDGLVVTSSSLDLARGVLHSVFVNKKEYTANVVTSDDVLGFSILKIENNDNTKFTPVSFSTTPIRLGQTVFVLGNNLNRTTASIGTVNSVLDSSDISLGSYKTNIKSDDTNIGGPVLDTKGTVVGINFSSGGVVPIKFVTAYLASSTPRGR